MGWDPSKGLGAENDGRTSHIKVVQKLNLLGIGAGPQQGPDAIAWRQNRDYEMLLKRLNQCVETNEKTETEAKGEDAEDQDPRVRSHLSPALHHVEVAIPPRLGLADGQMEDDHARDRHNETEGALPGDNKEGLDARTLQEKLF